MCSEEDGGVGGRKRTRLLANLGAREARRGFPLVILHVKFSFLKYRTSQANIRHMVTKTEVCL